MIKAVLFDLDNTLIDFMRMKRGSIDAAIKAMISAGVKIDKKKASAIIYGLYKQHGIEHQKIFQKFLREATGKLDYKALAAGIVAYRRAQVGMLKPYVEVVPTLRKLQKMGLKLAIVSDAPRLRAWLRLVELGIHDHFDVVVCFEDTGNYKHTGLPFKKALRLLQLKPEQCMMVGDWPERDMVGAGKLGIMTIFAKYGATKDVKDSGADFEIGTIRDVVAVVKKLK